LSSEELHHYADPGARASSLSFNGPAAYTLAAVERILAAQARPKDVLEANLHG
jgi:hypothetical protein